MVTMKASHKALTGRMIAMGLALSLPLACAAGGSARAAGSWRIGEPIATYWAGPPLTDTAAAQMRAGGWNLVWCSEGELDVARRHGLRAQLTDPLLSPGTLDDAGQRAKLDALIERVRRHPALYDYFITDEPNAAAFPGLGKLVAYLRERDPAHLAYINLFPTYASNGQLGTQGDTVTAYREHLRQYVDIVKPGLISYDHYQFTVQGDSDQYFLNLAMIRRAALDARLPFLNIVQASSWSPYMRVPNGREVRFLVYTSLAYGAQGISYYVYRWPDHRGGMLDEAGNPTSLYETVTPLNREFVAIARELQPLRSLGAYHAGMVPPGAEALPANSAFTLDPPLPPTPDQTPVTGVLLGCFGKSSRPTHVVAVNLDYTTEVSVALVGPRPLEVFEVRSGRWVLVGGKRATLRLPPGGGKLVRIAGR
jgi:hypothetical protein